MVVETEEETVEEPLVDSDVVTVVLNVPVVAVEDAEDVTDVDADVVAVVEAEVEAVEDTEVVAVVWSQPR